jgi:hypothetical protein
LVVILVDAGAVWPSVGFGCKGLALRPKAANDPIAILIMRASPDILLGISKEPIMGESQKRAIQTYRTRLEKKGLARFEVLGRDADRDLIRSLARRLAEEGPEAVRLRIVVTQSIAAEPPRAGGILAALRRSPLVGAELGLERPREDGRDIAI